LTFLFYNAVHALGADYPLIIVTWYLQVLKELQKVKDQFKECEMKNETLQTELAELQQQPRVSVLLSGNTTLISTCPLFWSLSCIPTVSQTRTFADCWSRTRHAFTL